METEVVAAHFVDGRGFRLNFRFRLVFSFVPVVLLWLK